MRRSLIYIFVLLVACRTSHEQALVSIGTVNEDLNSLQNEINPMLKYRFDMERLLSSTFDSTQNSSTQSLYERNSYAPFWTSDSLIQEVIYTLKSAKYHGISPKRYNVDSLADIANHILWDTLDASKMISFELSLSNALLLFTEDLSNGILDPKSIHWSWNYKSEHTCIDSLLYQCIDEKKNIAALFEPNHPMYSPLKKALKVMYDDTVEYALDNARIKYPGFTLRKGDSNEYVLPIKYKLLGKRIDGTTSMAFNEDLHQAVLTYQKMHGLVADGIMGKDSYRFINYTKQDYINNIKVNLERIRWMSDYSATKQIVVNIPSYTLYLYDSITLLKTKKVIVGKYKHQTPVFQTQLDYIVYNPCWTVPNSIASKSMLPRIQNDVNYLHDRNMFICKNGKEINPDTVDFSVYSRSNFPFKIFQRTSPRNALGKVKFMFDNSYSIYMHDTPSQYLFAKDIRAFSHGCIRLQDAMGFSEYLLRNIDQQTTPTSYYTQKGFPIKVFLDVPIPYSICYITCSLNPQDSTVVYHDDVYGYDLKVWSSFMDAE